MSERAERLERAFDQVLLVAAFLTIPVIVIEESHPGAGWERVADVLNWGIWLAFAIEVVTMLCIVPDRRRWLREHPLDIAIVVLTPPFLPASMQAGRLFRLLRLLQLVRGALVLRRLLSTEGIRDAAVLAVMTVLGGGAAYAAVETGVDGRTLSSWDGVWWAITTVTTVGYGDSYPVTTPGRIIAAIVMMVGIGFAAILTAAAAERFTRSQRQESRDLQAIREQLEAIARRLDAMERRDG